jgi:hypothetical protein
MKLTRLFLFSSVVVCGITLVAASCSTSTSGGTTSLGDVSGDVANLAAQADTQASQNATEAVDESSIAGESSNSSATLDIAARAVVGSGTNATITVTHSDSTAQGGTRNSTTLQDDVVTVVRSWTNAEGSPVVDTVTRPEIPGKLYTVGTNGSFTSIPANGAIGFTYNGSAGSYTLTGTEVKQVDGFQVTSNKITLAFVGGVLTSISQSGEQINLLHGGVTLTTTIYYSNGAGTEYMRILDYVTTSAKLKREVYVWGLSAAAVPSFGSASGTLTLVPAPSLSSSTDIIYQSDPSVALTSLTPTSGTYSSYPTILSAAWLRIVTSRVAPRVVDWYKPNTPTTGTYTRLMEVIAQGVGSKTTFYSTSDGMTIVKAGSAIKMQAAANGSITTTYAYSDGNSLSTTITPTTSPDGYTVSRTKGSTTQTYTVTFTTDSTTDSITGITVVNDSTSVSHSYSYNASTGTWS